MFRQKSMNKEAIIAEYLAGGITYRALADKCGVDFRILNYWVRCYQGRTLKENKGTSKKAKAGAKAKRSKGPISPLGERLPVEGKQLQLELHEARIHGELLNAMIDTAEEQLGISIRKKAGTRQHNR